MKLGLSTASFAPAIQGGRMSLQRIIDYAAQNGFEGLEIINQRVVWHKDIGDDVKMNLARMRERKLRYYSYGVEEDLCAADPQERWRAMNKVREAVLLACITNVQLVCIMGTGATNNDAAWDEMRPILIDGLGDCLELAAQKRITLALMNCGRLCNGSTRMLELLQQIGSDYLKISLDIASFLLVNEEPADAVRTLAADVRSVHFTDVRNTDTYIGDRWATVQGRQLLPCALGEGIVPQREVLYALKQVNYDGYINVLYVGDEEPAVGIERSASYLKTMLREVRSM
jgi:sugar phosphate isomerase/epimerase